MDQETNEANKCDYFLQYHTGGVDNVASILLKEYIAQTHPAVLVFAHGWKPIKEQGKQTNQQTHAPSLNAASSYIVKSKSKFVVYDSMGY